MKKLFLVFLPIAMLWSCKKQNDFTPKPNNLTVNNRNLFRGDGAYDVLGYGLDATRDILDPNSISLSPIINVSAFATAYASQLSSYLAQDNATLGYYSFTSGSTAMD